ncbi:hypothetical protein Tco_0127921 [Tanacetum coccineum]
MEQQHQTGNDKTRIPVLLMKHNSIEKGLHKGQFRYSPFDNDHRLILLQKIEVIDKFTLMDLIQKAHAQWDIEGDENSKFFHGLINQKRRNQMINGIMVTLRKIKEPFWDYEVSYDYSNAVFFPVVKAKLLSDWGSSDSYQVCARSSKLIMVKKEVSIQIVVASRALWGLTVGWFPPTSSTRKVQHVHSFLDGVILLPICGSSFFRWCDIPLFQASSCDSFNDWIISWHASKEKKHRFYVITTSVLWLLWRYRNSVTFNSQPLRKSDLFDNVRFSSFSWLHNRDHMELSWNDWLMYPLSITRNGNG